MSSCAEFGKCVCFCVLLEAVCLICILLLGCPSLGPEGSYPVSAQKNFFFNTAQEHTELCVCWGVSFRSAEAAQLILVFLVGFLCDAGWVSLKHKDVFDEFVLKQIIVSPLGMWLIVVGCFCISL